ncbi:hypothetical protein OBBRIDRAFT_790422 [Obba rivulosa]|uniref:Uncharacterized protein n=1 Tax=Obba rivulosa TaxID=1052685 RepID=A0A8E2J4M9_9APHY|nr:hypothetical protein OBBRIDRAFT_790422 [Obba rivulosa]
MPELDIPLRVIVFQHAGVTTQVNRRRCIQPSDTQAPVPPARAPSPVARAANSAFRAVTSWFAPAARALRSAAQAMRSYVASAAEAARPVIRAAAPYVIPAALVFGPLAFRAIGPVVFTRVAVSSASVSATTAVSAATAPPAGVASQGIRLAVRAARVWQSVVPLAQSAAPYAPIMVGMIMGAIIFPSLLAAVGFSAVGPVAGTFAAAWQASIGNVVAGSMFAGLQSLTMGGGAAAVGASAGGGIVATGMAVVEFARSVFGI